MSIDKLSPPKNKNGGKCPRFATWLIYYLLLEAVGQITHQRLKRVALIPIDIRCIVLIVRIVVVQADTNLFGESVGNSQGHVQLFEIRIGIGGDAVYICGVIEIYLVGIQGAHIIRELHVAGLQMGKAQLGDITRALCIAAGKIEGQLSHGFQACAQHKGVCLCLVLHLCVFRTKLVRCDEVSSPIVYSDTVHGIVCIVEIVIAGSEHQLFRRCEHQVQAACEEVLLPVVAAHIVVFGVSVLAVQIG